MFRVFLLVMLGGRGDNDFVQKLHFEIARILAENNLKEMLIGLEDGERDDFQIDLQLLGIDVNRT